jgi:hypothetical protein
MRDDVRLSGPEVLKPEDCLQHISRCRHPTHPLARPTPGNKRRSAQDGFDHGVGHPLLLLGDAKAPNCQKNKAFKDLGHYAEWPKVADAVIKALRTKKRVDYFAFGVYWGQPERSILRVLHSPCLAELQEARAQV